MGTVGGGPMIGNNRSTSTPNGEETKVHEHQTMVLWIGGRVEILVGSVIGGMAWSDRQLLLRLLPSIYQTSWFSIGFNSLWVVSSVLFCDGACLIR